MADDLVYIPSDYPDEYLDCRVERHAWRRCAPFDAGVPWGWPLYRKCANCPCRIAQSFNRLGEKIWEKRIYPEDQGLTPYQLKGAGRPDERPTLAEYRQLYFRRREAEWIEPMDEEGVRAANQQFKTSKPKARVKPGNKVVKMTRSRKRVS
jgi:1,2-phenylacetyl-CoA epoxidase PaaB subunit